MKCSHVSADSTYEVATESVTLPLPALPAAYAVTPTTSGNYTNALVTHSGGYLHLPENEVSLLIPEGCISRSRKHDIFLSILNEDCFRPKLNENLTQLSPVVSCGPNISLNKPVILKIPHCAELKRSDWNMSVLMSDCSDAQWQSVVTLGQETINTPVFCQLDNETAYLITDSLSRFVLVGQSLKGNVFKRLKLAVFAPKLCFQSSVDYSVRVYVLEDTESSMETVFSQEKRLGGCLMDESKSLLFQDSGNNLCLTLENISEGWKAKPSSNYQEIPFRHLWQASSNTLHCSFTLEAYEVNHNLNFTIRANQCGSECVQSFDILIKDQDAATTANVTNSARSSKQAAAVNTQKFTLQNECVTPKINKPGPPDEFNSPKSAKSFKTFTQDDFSSTNKSGKSLILSDKGVSTCDDFIFRLNKQVRKQLCQCLDPPTTRGNDWRMLAHALSVDRYINYFATKPSPTDCIMDLWEARHRQSNAMTDLVQIFRDMDRYDAVQILDNCLGPNWL